MLTAAVLVVLIAGTSLSVWGPWVPRGEPPVTGSPPPSRTPAASASPALPPSPASDRVTLPPREDWLPLETCAPDLEPRPADAPVSAPPMTGPVPLEVVGRLGGLASAATLDGEVMYAGVGSLLVRVDIADPARPRETAVSDPLPGQVEDIVPAGDLLVAAAGRGGLAILDRDDLSLRAALALPGFAEALAVKGDRAYVADGTGGLRIIDIADPSRPAEIGAALDLHRIVDVAVVGDVAHLAAADEGLIVVDVSDPTAPRELGRLFTGGYAFGVAGTDPVEVRSVVRERILLADGWGGLRLVDVTDPRRPSLVATLPSSGWALAVRVQGGDRAYLAEGHILRLVEISASGIRAAPDGPAFTSLPMAAPGYVLSVDVADDRVAVLDDAAGVRIFGMSDDGLAERGVYSPLGPPMVPFSGVAVSGGLAYLAAGPQGVRIVDVSDELRPREVGRIRTEEQATIATAVGSNVFIGTALPAVVGLDVADPELGPRVRMGTEPFWNVAGISTAVSGSLLFTAAEGGLLILDGSSSEACELGRLDAHAAGFDSFSAVGVAGDLAYMGGEEFRLVDVSDPREPVLVGTAATGEGVYEVFGMVVVDRTLYAIADTTAGWAVAIYGLATPLEPELQGLVRLPARPPPTSFLRGPVYGGGRLWVADGAAGLVAVDVSDPRDPRVAGRLPLPGNVMGLVIDGDHAYVISPGGGLFVVAWSAAPAAQTERGGPPTVGTAKPPASLASIGTTQPIGRCVVTSAADAGPGTLRACLEAAQTGTEIRFDPRTFPTDAPTTIRVTSPLPPLPDRLTVDGSGAGVVIDGAGLPEPTEDPWASNSPERGDHGLVVGSGSVVRGLTVTGFSGTGIFVRDGANTIADNVISANRTNGIVLRGGENRVAGNFVGLDPSGTEAWGAQRQGIWVQGSDRNVIGGPGPQDRNVISGNQMDIVIHGSANTVQGNYIGTDAIGRVKIRKDFDGLPGDPLSGAITFDCCSAQGGTIGNRIVGNVIAWGDISMVGPTTWFNEVIGNSLGIDATGTRWLGGGDHGPPVISVGPARFNRIGGTLAAEANVGDFSIIVADHVLVLGNRMGVDVLGNPLRVPYPGSGAIVVESEAVLGGRSPRSGNLVVGEGITVRASLATVLGNRVRATSSPPSAPGLTVGIRVEAGADVQLVANTVDAAEGIGILLGPAASGAVVRGNLLRDNDTGVLADAGSQGSLVTANRFEANRTQARDEGSGNAWDDGRRGNWWSDLIAVDVDGDGILDRPREITAAGIDRYPLAEPP